jgi:peptidoglycan/xylan/chitin deacetylase (PgdA/CDA1 family)
MLRPPGAHCGKKVEEVARRFGLETVLYSANCSKLEGTNKEKILRYVASAAQPGAIILMHNPDAVTLQALPEIIDTLKAKGYGFATLSGPTCQARARSL